jgi:protein-arginine kinase activator protein McsA
MTPTTTTPTAGASSLLSKVSPFARSPTRSAPSLPAAVWRLAPPGQGLPDARVAGHEPRLAIAAVKPTPEPHLRSVRPVIGTCQVCSQCQASKDLSEFAVKNAGRAKKCRACQKVHSDAHYQRNRAKRIADAAVRNKAMRVTLSHDLALHVESHCVCEACTSTVDLRWLKQADYTGPSMHEVMAGALGPARLAQAIAGSQVLCVPCMGYKLGRLGGTAKRKNRISAEKALAYSVVRLG